MTENRPTKPIAGTSDSTSSRPAGLKPSRIARIRAAGRILRHGCLYGQQWWEFETCPRCTGINYCVCKPERRAQTGKDRAC